LCELLEEINDYGVLKQRWTIGPLKLRLKRCRDEEKDHYHSLVLGRQLKTSVKSGEYQCLGHSVRFAKYNAPGLQTMHLYHIKEHPQWFLD